MEDVEKRAIEGKRVFRGKERQREKRREGTGRELWREREGKIESLQRRSIQKDGGKM